MKKLSLIVICIFVHLALSVVSVSQLIACGGGGCSDGKLVLNKVLGFPIFSLLALKDQVLGGVKSSGGMLLVLMPVNSIMMGLVIYFIIAWFYGMKRSDGK